MTSVRFQALCLPYEMRPHGGFYSFLAAFIDFLNRHNVPFTTDINSEYDVLFANSWVLPEAEIRRQKNSRPRLRVVQRIDGSAADYGRTDDADIRQARVNLLADLSIFQSAYSRRATREKFKVIVSDGPIIYNPVDLERFSPSGARMDLPGSIRIGFIAFSQNPMKGMQEIVRQAAAYPRFDFFCVGPLNQKIDLKNVHSLGYMERDSLAALFRSLDVFFFPARNESCPNVLLEAMASGLPIVYLDSGASPELAGECGLAYDADNFGLQIDRLVAERDSFGQSARKRAEAMFDNASIFMQYLQEIDGATRRPIPGLADRLRLRLRGYPVL